MNQIQFASLTFIFMSMLFTQATKASLTWQKSTNEISEIQNTHAAAVGVYNASVWLLGGNGSIAAVIEIDVSTDTAITHSNTIAFGAFASQLYCEGGPTGTVLFTSASGDSVIKGYDLQIQNLSYTIDRFETIDSFCIAANADYLFIIGGWSIDVFYVYDFISMSWFNGTFMLTNRANHGCNIVDSMLYVIGGNIDGVYTDSVHVIDISDPFNNSWSEFPDSLSVERDLVRSVAYKHFIYVMGKQNVTHDMESVDVIDTITQNIRYDSSMLDAKALNSPVVLNGILYSFGGTPTDSNGYYQYAQLPTTSPTYAPSTDPTIEPTIGPSDAPTAATNAPTSAPTNSTMYPTFQPTMNPTEICHDAEYKQSMSSFAGNKENDVLWGGQSLVSKDCRYLLTMNKNGDLAIYNTDDWSIGWHTNTLIYNHSGESVIKLMLTNGQIKIVEYVYGNVPSFEPIELWQSELSEYEDGTLNITNLTLTLMTSTLYDTACLTLHRYGAQEVYVATALWYVCLNEDSAIVTDSTAIVSSTKLFMETNEGESGKSFKMSADAWIVILVVITMVIVAVIVYPIYQRCEAFKGPWKTASLSDHHEGPQLNNFECLDEVEAEIDEAEKETTKQIQKWLSESTADKQKGESMEIEFTTQ